MKKSKFLSVAALAIVFTILVSACGTQGTSVLSSGNPVQVVDGATTRGGYTVSGSVTGGSHGWAFGAYFGDIGEVGYIEEEYFIEGTAQRYMPVGELDKTGNWTIEAVNTAAYKGV